MEIRPIDWPRDQGAIRELDTGFRTDRIYTVQGTGLTISLQEQVVQPPFEKTLEIAVDQEQVDRALMTAAAWEDGTLLGFAVVQGEAWNRRARVTDFYVGRRHRGRGLGRTLMNRILGGLDHAKIRQVWLETQHTNHPAIQFYLRMGFQPCGFDRTLYDAPYAHEVAIFMSRPPAPRA